MTDHFLKLGLDARAVAGVWRKWSVEICDLSFDSSTTCLYSSRRSDTEKIVLRSKRCKAGPKTVFVSTGLQLFEVELKQCGTHVRLVGQLND